MAAYFFDSSALVKRYGQEIGTAWVVSLFKPAAANSITVASITSVETLSALTRKRRAGQLNPNSTAKARARLRRAFAGKLRVIDSSPAIVERANDLAERHALRGYDAVQVAAALETNDRRLAVNATPLILISADDALNAAAMLEGLSVDNPNLHP